MASIDAIQRAMERVIIAATPTVSGPAFRRAPYNAPLSVQPLGRGSDGTRLFHVVVGALSGLGGGVPFSYNGAACYFIDTPASIQIRYALPIADGGYRRLIHLTAADEDVIIKALTEGSAAAWGADRPTLINFPGAVSIEPVLQNDTAATEHWLLTIACTIRHAV